MKKVLFTATVDSHILHFHIPYLKLFKENGYEVHVATNGDEKIPYCDVKHKISFERNPIKLNNLKAIKQLKKVIDKEKFDIIHCHTPMGSVVTRLAAKKARKNGTRVIYTAHGFHFYKGASLFNWLFFYPVEKYLSKYTDTLITINTEDYELAKNKFHLNDIYYIPGVGVDKEKFSINLSEKEKYKLRESLGIKDSDFVIIYVAELNKNKNQKMAIEAIKDLVKKDDKIKLLLVGKDSYNGKYQEMVKELGIDKNVIFTGYRKDIPQLMKISDLAISTSLREGLPVNLIEAMMSCLPIVCTNCRGNRDIAFENENAYLVDINDISSLEEKILKIRNGDFTKDYDLKNAEKYFIENVKINMENIYFKNETSAKTKKDIIFVVPSLGRGGIEICFLNMLRAINIQKYNITVLNLSDNEELKERIPNGVKLISLRKDEMIYFMPLSKSLRLLIKEKNIIAFIKRIMKPIINKIIYRYNGEEILWSLFSNNISQLEGHYDIAIGYGDGRSTYYVVDKIVSSKKFAWIHTDHEKARYNNNYNRKYYFKFDKIFLVSKYLYDEFTNWEPLLKNRCSVMYNVLELNEIKRKSNMNFENPFDSKNVNIISIGRITEEKNYKYAIKLALKLKQCSINFKWYVIGDGKDRAKLQKMIDKLSLNNIFFFLGEKENPYPYLKNADIYVQTSKYEGFSTTVTEAKLLLKPMLIPNVSGNSEQIENGKNGFIEPIETEEFFIKLKKLIEDKKIRELFYENLKKIEYNFTTPEKLESEFDLVNE